MGLRDWLGLGPVTVYRDSVPAPHPMIGFNLDGGLVTTVSARSSLGLSSVWRSLDILSNGVSQLTWHEKRGNLDLPLSRLALQPQADRTRREWVSLVVSTMALYDVCYLLKAGEDSEGVPFSLLVIPPGYISPITNPQLIPGLVPPRQYQLGNEVVDADRLVVLRRSPQPGLEDATGGIIQLARVTFAAAQAAEAYASRYWQSGGSPQTVLETDQQMPLAVADQYADRWYERRRLGPDYAPVLTGGLHARNMGADPTSEAAVEARRELVADIGRYFGIPTAILNAPAGDSETYSTTEAQGIHLVTYTLRNYISAIEDAISDQLPGGRYIEMDSYRLTQGTNLAQAQAFQLGTGGKAWLTQQDVRDRLGLPPVEDPNELADPAGSSPQIPATGGIQ